MKRREFIAGLSSAVAWKALGLTIPEKFMLLADEVIE
jgi:hypothetical protein